MDEQRKRLRLTLPQEMEESILALQKSRYPQQSLSQVLRLLLSLGLEQAAREQDRTPNGRTPLLCFSFASSPCIPPQVHGIKELDCTNHSREGVLHVL